MKKTVEFRLDSLLGCESETLRGSCDEERGTGVVESNLTDFTEGGPRERGQGYGEVEIRVVLSVYLEQFRIQYITVGQVFGGCRRDRDRGEGQGGNDWDENSVSDDVRNHKRQTRRTFREKVGATVGVLR